MSENLVLNIAKTVAGRTKKSILREDIFSENLSRYIKGKVTQDKFVLAYYLTGKYINGLKICREGNLNLCQCLHQEADRFFKKHIQHPIVKNFVLTMALPAKAYVAYKDKRYEEAITLSEDTLVVDEALENAGLELMHMHKLQQFQNIGRVYHRTLDFDKWIDISIELINYQLQTVIPEYYKEKWDFDRLNQCSPVLRERMLVQAVDEIIDFCMYNFKTRRAFQQKIFGSIRFSGEEEAVPKQLQDWIKVKTYIWNENETQLKNSLVQFLNAKSENVSLDIMKVDLLIDACSVYKSQEDLKILEEAILSHHIPERMKTTISNYLQA